MDGAKVVSWIQDERLVRATERGGVLGPGRVLTDLVRDDLPFVAGSRRHSRPTRDGTRRAARARAAQLPEPRDADLASGLARRQKVPETGAIACALVASPLREKTEALVKVDADGAAA